MAGIPLETALSRGLKLRCPRCGEGRLFTHWIRMHSHCSSCNLKYERDPGYFLGSAYINYGLTSVILTVSYLVLRFGFGYENRTLAIPLVAFCVIFPLYCFRYARSLWLAMDCYFDLTGFELNEWQQYERQQASSADHGSVPKETESQKTETNAQVNGQQ